MTLKLHCPICKKIFQMDKKIVLEDPFFPFCSERCKMSDLHGWLTQRYSFSSPFKEDEKKQSLDE